jgi:hypothetical protein
VIGNLENGTLYRILINVVDIWGNKSMGIELRGTPKKPVEPPKPPSGGGISLPIVTPTDQQTFSVGPSAQTLVSSNGEFIIEIPEGAFEHDIQFTVKIIKDEIALGSDITQCSNIIEIDTGGVNPKKPIILRIKYNNNTGLDVRRLGIYRQDDKDRTKWIYKGGIVDASTGVLSITLMNFSRYGVMAYNHRFKDIGGHWSERDVEVLVSRHIVKGVNEEEFQPDRKITRAEILTLFVELLNSALGECFQDVAPKTPIFDDVLPNAWYFKNIQVATRLGLAKGEGNKFRPNDPITREEMCVMLSNILKFKGASDYQLPHKDAEIISEWALDSVKAAHGLGIITEIAPGEFSPKTHATRAQAAVVILKTMERLGLINEIKTIKGRIAISEIEGENLILVSDNGNKKESYILNPVSNLIKAELQAALNQELELIGFKKNALDIYMQGPILNVYWIGDMPKLPGG